MKIEILVTLLFVAVASASLDGASEDDGTGMCPREYMHKHPEFYKKKKDFIKKYGHPDFSKLKSCSSEGICDKGMKCCETPCGMKCVKAVFENNGLETLEQICKEIGSGPYDEAYEVTDADKKYGMCPDNYIKTHPEIMEEMKKERKHKHSHEERKDGKTCHHKHAHYKKHFRNFTTLADCSADGDCSDNMRCCNTMCGKKCVKPVFTKEDLKESLFGKNEKNNRKKREVEDEDEEDMDQDDEMEHGMEHGRGCKHGKGHRKGGKHKKGQCKGGDHGMCHGKGAEHGMCQGKGGGHGKCQGKGGEHGKCRGKGGDNGKRHGKGHRKGCGHGREHGKGHRNAQEHEEFEEEEEYSRQKRSLNSMGGFRNNNGGDNGMQGGCPYAKGKGKGKKKGRGIENN